MTRTLRPTVAAVRRVLAERLDEMTKAHVHVLREAGKPSADYGCALRDLLATSCRAQKLATEYERLGAESRNGDPVI